MESDLLRPRLAAAGGLGLLALGAALGACLDVALNLRAMHVMLATSFILLAVLMLKVQIGRFYRPDKGPGDWVAWLHFVIFAFLLFLAARMLRRWGRRCPSVVAAAPAPFPPPADVDHNDDDHVATPARRLVVTYRGKTYDGTDFAARHPGGSIIWAAHGRDVEEVWREHGVQWHANAQHAFIGEMIRNWPEVTT